MILQELVKLCDSEELIPMPDFQWRQTHWHINIDANGKLLGPPVCVKEEIPVPNTNNRTITQGLDTILPWTIQPRTNEPESEFLCDNITYTFGFYSKEAKKLDKKMSLYQRYLIDALSATNDPGISAQLKCINMIRTKPQMLFNYWGDFSQKGKKAKDAEGNSIFLPKEWEDTDVFVFKFENKLVVHRQPVIDYWQRLRQNRREELPKGQCLISGKIAALALKHMQVKLGTASADPKGCSVVSFNNNAFTSYGLKKNANAQISQENMEKYAVALQMLLSPVGGKSKNVKCAVHNYLLSKEIRAVFWVDYPKKDSTITEILQGCFHGNISVIKELLDSPHTGKQIEINNAVNFLCFTMAAAKSRVIILSDLKTTLPKLQQALLAYYNDIELHTNEHEPSLCLKNILESAKPEGKNCEGSRNQINAFFQAIVMFTPYPLGILNQTITKSLVVVRDKRGKARYIDTNLFRLIKAILNRNFNYPIQSTLEKTMNAMRKQKEDSIKNKKNFQSYQLGRIFAVIEKAQKEAINSNEELNTRFLKSATMTPARTFLHLLEMFPNYIAKLNKSGRNEKEEKLKKYWAQECRNTMAEIFADINSDFNPEDIENLLPKRLNLEEQGILLMGYYQQRASFFTKKENGQETDQE